MKKNDKTLSIDTIKALALDCGFEKTLFMFNQRGNLSFGKNVYIYVPLNNISKLQKDIYRIYKKISVIKDLGAFNLNYYDNISHYYTTNETISVKYALNTDIYISENESTECSGIIVYMMRDRMIISSFFIPIKWLPTFIAFLSEENIKKYNQMYKNYL